MPGDVRQDVAVLSNDHYKIANDAAVFGDGEHVGGDVGKFRLLLACFGRRKGYCRRWWWKRQEFKRRLKLSTAKHADGQQHQGQAYLFEL